jgi:hypothetical protein
MVQDFWILWKISDLQTSYFFDLNDIRMSKWRSALALSKQVVHRCGQYGQSSRCRCAKAKICSICKYVGFDGILMS